MNDSDEISREECRKQVDVLWRSFLNFAAEGSQELGQVCIERFEERMHADASKMPADKAAKYLSIIDEERGLIMDEYTNNPEGLKRRLGVRGRPAFQPRPQSKVGACFIATAVYGGYETPQVRVLRSFRDRHMTSHVGKQIVDFYYCVSPPIARWLVRNPKASAVAKVVLDGVVWFIAGTERKYKK